MRRNHTLLDLFFLLYLTVLLYPSPLLARPTTDTQTPSLSPHHEALPPDPLPAIHSKRVITTYYNNLGGKYTMILTNSAIGLIYSSLAASVAPPTAVLEKLFESVIEEAKHLTATNAAPIRTLAEWGVGQIKLSFLLRNAYRGNEAIPWSMVQLCAKEFLKRAQLGLPAAFRAQVNGPFGGGGGNGMGGVPWVEVVLTVGGKMVTDGIEWGIF